MIGLDRVLAPYSADAARPLGLSVGVAVYDPATVESLEGLLARADAAMYAVKHAGKGSYRMAPSAGTASAETPP